MSVPSTLPTGCWTWGMTLAVVVLRLVEQVRRQVDGTDAAGALLPKLLHVIDGGRDAHQLAGIVEGAAAAVAGGNAGICLNPFLFAPPFGRKPLTAPFVNSSEPSPTAG